MAMNYTGFGQPQSFYTLSGGTIGGASIWNPDMRSIRPEVQAISRAMGKKGVMVLPSGAGSRQELRYMRERAEQQGYDWTEAPTKYTRGAGPTSPRNKNQPLDPTGFYDAQGRKFTGTLMWVGGGWGGGRKEQRSEGGYKKSEPIGIPPKPEQEPAPEGYVRNRFGYLEPESWYKEGGAKKTESEFSTRGQETQNNYIQSQYGTAFSRSPMGFTGRPESFTVAGGRMGVSQSPTATSTNAPFAFPQTRQNPLLGFGGVPQFPFANY